MLYSQKVKGGKHLSSDDLEALFKQKAQYKLFGFTPYLTIHYFGKSFYDTAYISSEILKTKARFKKKIREKKYTEKRYLAIKKKEKKKIAKLNNTLQNGNWLMSSFGEFPSLLDTSNINYTREQIQIYLSSRGFFRNKVEVKIDTLGRKTFVSYLITEGPSYHYSEVGYAIEDSSLYQLITIPSKTNKIKVNNFERYDESRIDEERERIYKLLKNNGYYDFTRQYINFQVDTTIGNHSVKMTIDVDQPEEGNHIRYRINKVVYMPTIISMDSVATVPDTLTYKKIQYCFYKKHYNYKILDGKIRLKAGSYFKQDSIQRTQQQLGSMDMFSFVNVNMLKVDSAKLDMLIYTSPLKKYSITQEYGLNVYQGGIPGPFFNISFRDRNFFKNYEIFDISARYAIEGQASVLDDKTKLQTIEWGVNAGLTFPQLLVPTKLRFNAAKFNPKTRISLGYNFTNRPEYDRYGFGSSFSYIWQKGENSFFTLSPININIINSTIKMQDFEDYLITLKQNGNNLYVSFLPSFVTNINFSYTFANSVIGKIKTSYFIRPSIEIGGIVPNFVSTYITKEENSKLFGLQYYEYYKVQIDFRHYKPLNKKTMFASRFNLGYSRPFGATGIKQNGSFVLPYEKYFFTGGTNTNRAWPYRRLGPGTYTNPDPNQQYTNEEPGNIIIETNFEFRRKIYKFIEGAYFIDAGNVWSIKDPTRPGSEFNAFKSLTEVGVGTGIGARLNFTFIIVRFDLAWRVWDPAQPLDTRFVLFDKGIYNKPILNFSIGYPF
ncbi:MAG: BamA/TamA family outer membrane protein [Cytophagales bacterium]|nr:BamA/TamA family outer membrane protein [Cytophaga sp.]